GRAPGQGPVDLLGCEDVVDGEPAGAERAALLAGSAGRHGEPGGGQRQRPLVDDLPDPGEQRLVHGGQRAADDDGLRVEEVDQAGEDVADAASGLADHPDRERVPGGDQGGHRAAVGGRHAGLGEPGGQCAAAGDRLQAAGVAAAARDVVGAGHPDVPDVAGGALGPAVQPPAGDDAAADAGADLDEEQVLRGGAAVPELAQRQGVDVVVDQDVEVVAVGEVAGDGVLVPARHDR